MDFDFDFSELNPAAMGLAFIGAIFALIIAKSMYPVGGIKGILVMFLAFIGTLAACYFLVSKISQR